MKTVVNIEQGQPLKVERYEGKLKVGERSLTLNDFIGGLLNEVEIDFILDHLINDRFDDFEETAQYINRVSPNARKVLATLVGSVARHELPNEIDELIAAIFSHVKPTTENAEQFAQLMFLYLDTYSALNGPHFEELAERLFSLVVGNTPNSKLAQKLVDKLVSILKYKYTNKRNLEPIQEWVKTFLPLLDKAWLKAEYDHVMNNRVTSALKVQYGFTTIPKGCVGISMNSTGKVYVLEVPKSQFRTKLFDLVFEDVGHPRLLFIVHANDKEVTNVKCVAVPEKAQITDDMVVYHYPYSNVFRDGRICWGDCPKELTMISNIPMLFLSTMNNKHLCSNIDELYEKYQNKAFNDNELVPFEDGQLLKDFYE